MEISWRKWRKPRHSKRVGGELCDCGGVMVGYSGLGEKIEYQCNRCGVSVFVERKNL